MTQVSILNFILDNSQYIYVRVAQLVEHRSYTPGVVGSNPTVSIIEKANATYQVDTH